jgi:hypothetical protein
LVISTAGKITAPQEEFRPSPARSSGGEGLRRGAKCGRPRPSASAACRASPMR